MVNVVRAGRKLANSIADFLFPPLCPICKSRVAKNGDLCDVCMASINWILCPRCAKCGYPLPQTMDWEKDAMCPMCLSGKCELDMIRSACVYDAVSRQIVLPFKHSGRISNGAIMSRTMMASLVGTGIRPDVVIPVPLAWRRLWHRGYNQATILARPIARYLGVPVDVDSIRRKYRPDMGHKNARQRFENIHGVFSVVHPDKIRGRKILLVDDVMTTGATFFELQHELMRAGAAAVYGVTFCRAVRA